MVRFIFICMGVVALSVIAMGAQFMIDGISGETINVAARNVEDAPIAAVANPLPAAETDLASQESFSPEQLNSIETTAGDANDSFKGGFTDEAPKALQDPSPATAGVAPAAD